MNISNLQRAAEIAEQLPALDKARKALADAATTMRLETAAGDVVTLPQSVRHNVLNIINCEYERLREEARSL